MGKENKDFKFSLFYYNFLEFYWNILVYIDCIINHLQINKIQLKHYEWFTYNIPTTIDIKDPTYIFLTIHNLNNIFKNFENDNFTVLESIIKY